jgi:hypothetical protein
MSEDASRAEELWLLALALASTTVVVIAVLFGLAIVALQRIDRHGAHIHSAAKQIAQNTVALWALDQMNRDLVAIRDAARNAEPATGGPPTTAVAEQVESRLGASDHDDDKGS